MRRLSCLFAAVLAYGCASVPAPTTLDAESRQGLGRVAVVAAGPAPIVDLAGIPADKLEAGMSAGGVSLGGCVAFLAPAATSCAGTPIGCAVAAAGMVVLCPVAALVGGSVGAAKAESGERVEAARARMQLLSDAAEVHKGLRDEVARLARAQLADRYVELPDAADTVLEVSLVSVRTSGSRMFNPPLQLHIEARARAVRVSDHGVLFDSKAEFEGARHKLAEWMADGAQPLQAEVERAHVELARHIVDHNLLLFPFPDRQMHPGGLVLRPFGLAPEDPPTRGPLMPTDVFLGPLRSLRWERVGSLQPELRWEKFPRHGDLEAAPAEMARVKNVSYDLVIVREHDSAAAGVVYRRERIASNAHVLQAALEPDSRYFWSVRARFELDGREHVTEWGRVTYQGSNLVSPHPGSYRFATP